MALCCSTCPVMPYQTRSAVLTLKLLVLCYSLADTDLTAANLRNLQQEVAVRTMLLGQALGLRDSDKT